MKTLGKLLDTFAIPDENNISISTGGYSIWFTWSGPLNPAITQIFQDYGGIPVTNEDDQALWFFFSTEVLLALAKLTVWADYNPTSMLLQAFPATLLVDSHKNLSLQTEKSLHEQVLHLSTEKLFILVHPKLQEAGKIYPGITYNEQNLEVEELQDCTLSKERWQQLSANSRLPYASSQGWYSIIHPLGSPLDKKFQAGWRNMFAEIELILQRLKVRYSIFDTYLIVPIDTLSLLRNWTRELIQTLFHMKDNFPEKYWPCVSIIVDKKGLNLNNELPQKVNVQWDTLTPNFPYINYRNAYLLGEGFTIQDLHFSSGKSSITQWCTVVHDSYSIQANRTPVLLPDSFVTGSYQGCFYCGMKSHETSRCPSKNLKEASLTFWEDFNNVDLEDINATFRAIEVQLSKEGMKAFKDIFEENTIQTQVLEGVFNINGLIQPRSLERIWLLPGRDIYAPVDPQSYKEESQCWNLLQRLLNINYKDLSILEKDVYTASSKNPRDWRLKSLLGFVCIERNDYTRALNYWKEAESNTSSILHQAWHYFLIGRIHEILGQYDEAMDYYTSSKKILTFWLEPSYRILVCRVKMGFAEQVQGQILQLIKDSPTYFNRILLDPELERGHLPIMTMLYPLWLDMIEKSSLEKNRVLSLLQDLDDWFFPEHQIASIIRQKIEELISALDVRNYLAFRAVINVRPILEEDLRRLKDKELQDLKDIYKSFLSTLEAIRDEASWFPFSNALRGFNRDFNECASILNWAFATSFSVPEVFKQAQGYLEPVHELLKNLEEQLKLIRTVRDVTLFALILFKSFLYIEIAGLILCFIVVPVITFYGDAMGLAWLQRLIKMNFWELQSVLISVVSAIALGFAILTTAITFDKKRASMLETAKQQREQYQQQRLARILEQKRREQENNS